MNFIQLAAILPSILAGAWGSTGGGGGGGRGHGSESVELF